MTKSRIAGDGTSMDGRTSYQVYEATQELTCEGCYRRMPIGTLFTRQMLGGGGSRRYPFCFQCRPFRFGEPLSWKRMVS